MANNKDIQFHYDVGNDFFKFFLDEKHRAYSCGVWKETNDLIKAQENKLKRLANYSHFKPGHTILDIGCGWGGMLNYALNIKKVKQAIGLTLSQAQFNYLKQTSFKNTEVHLCSWSEFIAKDKFDAIVSIGAMEHFASLENEKKKNKISVYRNFFKKCHMLLADNAFIGLQTIITVKKPNTLQSMKDAHFLLKHVFPGSALPTMHEVLSGMKPYFELNTLKTIGPDYVKTLAAWEGRLDENKDLIIKRFSEKLWQHYKNYFKAAKRSFMDEHTSLTQMSLRKI